MEIRKLFSYVFYMTDADLPPAQYVDRARARRSVDALHEAFIRSGSRFALAEFSAALSEWVAAAAEPERALTNLQRFVAAVLSVPTLFNDLLQYPLYGDLLFRLFGASQYFADVLIREPGLFPWLTSTDALSVPLGEEYLRGETSRVFETFQSPEKRLDALKRIHRRELLRIGARDLLGRAGLAEVTAHLSLLADAMIDGALCVARQQTGDPGTAFGTIPFCVIGLGKLGGNELNYSSDVDLLFVYGEEAEGKGSGTAHEYFNRLAQRLVRNLSGASAEGHLYRVDTRLRPESGAGPLARSLTGYLTYYESRGELWERQMLIKARPVAGDRSLGREYIARLEPFVYPRTMFEHPAAAVARIKARIEAEVGTEANLKLMAGGIRDIEFIVQTLQLVNGGLNPAVRERNTLAALAGLQRHGMLDGHEAKALGDAYILYRTLEHRLQMVLNTQTHTIPADETSYAALARRVGMDSPGDLRRVLDGHLERVRRLFRQVMVAAPESPSAIAAVTEEGIDDGTIARILGGQGFRDSRQAARCVRFLTAGNALTGEREHDARTRAAFRAVAPEVFSAIARVPDPDLALASFTSLAGGQKIPHVFFGQLADPRFRRFVLEICARSPRFARGLARDPLLLDMLASDPGALAGAPSLSELPDGDLIAVKVREELRAGIRHVLGFTDFDGFTGELSLLASRIVATLLLRTTGVPRGRIPLAVFALGKLGTGELGLDADLDLLFVAGKGGRGGHEEAENAAGALMQALGTVSADGRLYDADVRLRPEGRNAPLVAEASSYANYLATRASLWERQSLTRLRFIAGDPTVGSVVASMVASWVYDAPLPEGWSAEIVAMRRKMESRSRTRVGGYLDIKLGAGGMADIEFIAQMIQLKMGGHQPELRGRPTVTVLRSAGHGALSIERASYLASAYGMFRRLEFLLRAGLEDRSWILPDGETLARLYDGASAEALRTRVEGTMKRVRSEFLDIARSLA
ncbi:MAG: hypothetical protein AB1428_03300 [Bacteroidota bacterium]